MWSVYKFKVNVPLKTWYPAQNTFLFLYLSMSMRYLFLLPGDKN